MTTPPKRPPASLIAETDQSIAEFRELIRQLGAEKTGIIISFNRDLFHDPVKTLRLVADMIERGDQATATLLRLSMIASNAAIVNAMESIVSNLENPS